MLPITTAAWLLLLLWAAAVPLALVLERYWARKFRTPARKRERVAEKVTSRNPAELVWVVTGLGILLGLPAMLIVDGLVLRIGLLYHLQLSFFTPFDTQLQLLGAVLAAVGIVILFVAGRTLAEHVFGKATDERELVTTGLHAHVRHPFYLGIILIPVGLILLTLNYLASLLLIPAWFERDGRFLTQVVAEEERDLAERFGAEYEAYREQTGRFFPKFW